MLSTIKIGDVIFTNKGEPAIVTDIDDKTNNLKVQTSGKEIEEAKKRGFVNGLSLEERKKFNVIIDKIQTLKDPTEKIRLLQNKINQLSEDPRNYRLLRYVKAELAHVMYSDNMKPNYYIVDPANL